MTTPHEDFKGKVIPWHEDLPPCDVCKDEAPYDVPTTQGPWANLCTEDFPLLAVLSSKSGYYRKVV